MTKIAKSKFNKIVGNYISTVWFCEEDGMLHSYKVIKDITDEYKEELEDEEQRYFRIRYCDGRDIIQERDVLDDEILEETFMYYVDFERVLSNLYNWLDGDELDKLFNKLLPIFQRF